jgi:two-component system, LytTR family, sensor kinase
MNSFLKKYKYRVIGGFFSLLLMFVFLKNFTDADRFYFGIYIKGMFAPVYFLLIIITFYLKDILFKKRKFCKFFFGVLLIYVIASFFMYQFAPYGVGNSFTEWLIYLIGILFIVTIASFIRFMKEQLQNELDWTAFKAKQNEAELKLLKQQLNPHFLFNTLNSVYAKCLENNAEAGDMVLQLSDMLRYQLESDNTDKKTISEEVNFIDNYIYFEKRRLSPKVEFHYHKNLSSTSSLIAANILVTLIENAFKHSAKLAINSLIDIKLDVTKTSLNLTTKNTFNLNIEKGTTKIGLNNLRKRLAYLYPKQHELTIWKDEFYFYASLSITL